MSEMKRKYWILPGIIFLVIYMFVAARPIREETVLFPRWISSLESGLYIDFGGFDYETDVEIPFRLGSRFGFFDDSGQYLLNRVRNMNLSLSNGMWSEYEAQPAGVEIFNPQSELLMTIDNPIGYPFFMDNRAFLLGNEQNSISALDNLGNIIWTYDFSSPLTCIDAASGFIVAGTLDGVIELLDSTGRLVFSFEPGGSRLAVILGVAISTDGARLAVISGIDNQRFLMLEQSGDIFRVVYHKFLSTGFRRAVHINFINNDARVAFEQQGGLGLYDIAMRSSLFLPLEGEMAGMDTGDGNYLFVISSQGEDRKRIFGIRMPGEIMMNAPFRSRSVFLDRRDSKLYIGGDYSLASFELNKK